METFDQEIQGIKKEIGELPAIERTLNDLAKGMERQNQMMLRFMKSATQERSTMNEKITELSMRSTLMKNNSEGEGSSIRKSEPMNVEKKTNEENKCDQNKFKKVEMPIFNGDDSDSWLFRAERYFQIHKFTEFEKMIVATISFEGPALNWYRSQEEQEKFTDWANLKERVLIRFRSTREGSLYGRFLRIQQTTTVEEYRIFFDKWVAPLSNLPEKVVEETFMSGLKTWIQAEMDFCEPKGLSQMMRIAQKVENREDIRREANLPGYSRGKLSNSGSGTKVNTTVNSGDNKGSMNWPMRTITLRGTSSEEARKEGPTKRLSDAEFQSRKEKGLCFRCKEKYSHDHKCKTKEHRELRMLVVMGENGKYEIIEEDNTEQELNTIEIT